MGTVLRQHQAVAVLVLQAFAGQRGAAGGAAQQEALPRASANGPDEVAHALESEHRIVDEERNHLDPVVGVGRAGRRERRHRARPR